MPEKPQGFPKKERVCGEKRVTELFREGRGGFVYPFRYVFTVKDSICGMDPGNEVTTTSQGGNHSGTSVLITVPKKLHKKAYKRNLLKRRTREAYRTGKQELHRESIESGKQVDIALLYITKETEDYDTVRNAVGKIIGQISESL